MPSGVHKGKGRGRGGGRPKIPIITESIGSLEDKLPPRPIILEQVLYWMDLGGTAEEIAGSFHVSTDTLNRRLIEITNLSFAQLKEKSCGSAKLKLRNNQFKLSEHNASMGIWLGKIWLGQSDKDEVKELAHDVIKQAVRELQTERGIQTISRPALETQSSILDKGQPGQQNKVQSELGTTGTMERSPSLQDSPESPTAGHNDVFMPPFP